MRFPSCSSQHLPMSYSDKPQRSANALSGRTARACDSCLRCRARWYCGADDAFLCQACDASVHSANPLARRHERVRLKTSSSYPIVKSDDPAPMEPTWLHGFKRKARTPRPYNLAKQAREATSLKLVEPLVPDLEMSDDNNDKEQLLYCVPIFDPVLAKFCSPPPLDDSNNSGEKMKPGHTSTAATDGHAEFHPSDLDLMEFAADVESLLGRGLTEDAFCMEGLGLMDSTEEDMGSCLAEESGRVKVELEDELACCHLDTEMVLSGETLDLNFDCGSPMMGEELEEEKTVGAVMVDGYEEAMPTTTRVMLRLDYEAVITAWSSQGCSPWTNGERPQLNPDDCWLEYMGIWAGGGEVQVGGGGHVGAGDGGREARVTRYREKRRTRLFSKKIRYEVRKLNAEKRPRMKGRFVKRASFTSAAPASSPY